MKHLLDETYKGHELVYSQDGHWITVDIRSDDYDGGFIQGYTQQLTILDARMKASGFVDGWQAKVAADHSAFEKIAQDVQL